MFLGRNCCCVRVLAPRTFQVKKHINDTAGGTFQTVLPNYCAVEPV
jgi:hypothetical protein